MKPVGLLLAVVAAAACITPSFGAPTEAGTQARVVQLARIVVKLGRGQRIGHYKDGIACAFTHDLTWQGGGTQDLDTREFDDIFADEVKKFGFTVAGDPSNLFESGADSAEYLVGGTIDNLSMNICYTGGPADDKSKGKGTLEVNWQIYSVVDHEVVETIRTTGTFEERKSIDGGMYAILTKAFADSVRQLASNERFRSTFKETRRDLSAARPGPAGLAAIEFVPATAAHESISDAAGSTVLVLSGMGHGSGFLVGGDGVILTNAHVVGSAKYVKVRWPDKVESLGEVIRLDKPRDVALVKTDSRNRRPLHVRTTPAVVGEDVYAIGAPLDPNLQSSVTKGIVSANRIIDGMSFIQSDVTVNPGNSGGPLLDQNRNVIGITVLSMRPAGIPSGINLFIPITDAENFLGMHPKAP